MKIEHLGDTARFSTYSRRMIEDPAGIAEELRLAEIESGITFDTIVGRGSSGMMIVPLVAHILGKKFFIVRKDSEVESSHDRDARWLGDLGRRWIFLDDFCSSGATFQATRDGVNRAVKRACMPTIEVDWLAQPKPTQTITENHFETELVGYFQYGENADDSRRLVPWDELASPGYNDAFLGDTPRLLARQAHADARQAEADERKGYALQAEADQRAEEEIERAVMTTPTRSDVYPVTGSCEDPACRVCGDAYPTTEITTWGDTQIRSRYAMASVTNNAQPNLIVRNI
jgi:hypothetical protein